MGRRVTDHDRLLVLKEKLKQFYKNTSIYVTLAVKFLIGCLTFALISGNIGFMAKLNSPVILMGLAVVCAFLPYGVIVCLAAAVVLTHFEQCVIGTDPDFGGMFPDHRDFVLWISAWGRLSAAADSDFYHFKIHIPFRFWLDFPENRCLQFRWKWNICILYPSVCKSQNAGDFDK